MYIFELVFKLIKDGKRTKMQPKGGGMQGDGFSFDETDNMYGDGFENSEKEKYFECEHVFLPVDSTKKVLACTKCGMLKKVQ